MKKQYVKPHVTSIELEMESPFLATSSIEVGGTTEEFYSLEDDDVSGFINWNEIENKYQK